MKCLKNLREKRGLTQKEIADAMSIDTSTVTKWETGESRPRADKLPEIAKLLGCTIDDLFDEKTA